MTRTGSGARQSATSAGGDERVVVFGDAGLKALAVRYVAQRRLAMNDLRRALVAGDYETLWIAGHHMHGAGGSFGVERISVLGAALEFSAFERDQSGVTERLNELEAFLERVELV
jgi:HPt (histidine-containing phosphotransfer) domain-containing protein